MNKEFECNNSGFKHKDKFIINNKVTNKQYNLCLIYNY